MSGIQSESSAPSASEDDSSFTQSQVYLSIPMPQVSSNITSSGYQRALANRFPETDLWPGGLYDITVWKPIFIHDTLMLPGSLANLLDMASSHDMINRMTPAFMPGFIARVDAETNQPRLLSSSGHVQGMLVVGLTKSERRLIHTHYRDHAKRKTVMLEIAIVEGDHHLSSPKTMRVTRPHEKRMHIQAYAWVCKDRKRAKLLPDQQWTLENFLEGKYEKKQTALRMSKTGKGDEDNDGFIGREVVEREIRKEKREKVFSGSGGAAWERARYDTGW